MHGKTQNVNESFDGTNFVTLPNLGVCDGVAHCNIRMKAPVLFYQKLDFVPVVCMLKGLKKGSSNSVNLVN